jgi:hypothetical protein
MSPRLIGPFDLAGDDERIVVRDDDGHRVAEAGDEGGVETVGADLAEERVMHLQQQLELGKSSVDGEHGVIDRDSDGGLCDPREGLTEEIGLTGAADIDTPKAKAVVDNGVFA